MAELTYFEKDVIENLFGLKSGYVLEFNNFEFHEFVYSAVKKDIFDKKYEYRSNSKANLLRQFIKIETNFIVGTLLDELTKFWLMKAKRGDFVFSHNEMDLHAEMQKIIENLLSKKNNQQLELTVPVIENDKDFSKIASYIKECIDRNEPELALDRLHTFLFKIIRNLCVKHQIEFSKVDSLNSVFGKYVKFIVSENKVDSLMSEKILKYSISIIEAFNDVRNNKSLAHDNPILNPDESLLILTNISASINFIDKIENQLDSKKESDNSIDDIWF